MIHVICILEPFFMREEFLHMENKNAGYIWHPVWHIIPGLKNTKQNLKNSKLKKKNLQDSSSIEMYLKQWKIIFFCKSIEDGMQIEVFPSKIRTQIWKYDKAVWKGKRLSIQANDFKLENDTIMKCIFVDKIQCS